MGLGGVKRRRRGKLVEQLSFRIAMRATTVFERGRFRVILRKHFSRFWSLGGFQNGRAVRQNERNRLLDRPAMAPFCAAPPDSMPGWSQHRGAIRLWWAMEAGRPIAVDPWSPTHFGSRHGCVRACGCVKLFAKGLRR